MHLNNNPRKDSDLSILVHGDGFSFCTQDQHHLLEVKEEFPSVETLKSWVDYHQLHQTNIKLIYGQQAAVTVPLSLFDEKQAASYLKGAISLQDNLQVGCTPLDKNEQVVVYAINKKQQALFASVFPSATQSHIVAEMLPALAAFSFKKGKKNLFVHLQKDSFDLFLFQGSQLLLQNSFPHKNADDFLYYLFYVTEQFYLKPDQFDLYFLGKYTPYTHYYSGVQEFHTSSEHLDPIFPSVDAAHPIPFFHYFNGA